MPLRRSVLDSIANGYQSSKCRFALAGTCCLPAPTNTQTRPHLPGFAIYLCIGTGRKDDWAAEMLESMQTHGENILYHVWLISYNAFLGSIQDFYSYLLFLTVQDK